MGLTPPSLIPAPILGFNGRSPKSPVAISPMSIAPNALVAPVGPVLVAGGAGYIGSHTVRLLQQRGVDVVVLDNLSAGHRASTTATLEEVDLGDRTGLAAVFAKHKPSAVVHFAAKCYVGESVTDPSKYYLENVHHTWCLLEAMREAGCRDIVFSSTCATYGEPQIVPIPDDHPQNPINPYGRTKLHMEHMLQDFGHAYGMRWAALRYFNAAGAASDGCIGEDHEPETHLIPLVLQVAQGKREHISIFGDDYDTRDGTCVRDYIHIDDLGDAHLRALALLQSGTKGFACNLGTGEGFTVLELIEEARRVTGHAIPVQMAPRREGDPATLVSGGKLAKDVLGWTPKRSDVRTILEDAWRWHQAHRDGFE
ncbi:MAG: UDP-glucose 4-epimerase, partial [Planctomycetota bacterium]